MRTNLFRAGATLAAVFFATLGAVAGEGGRGIFVVTSTNSASGNAVVVFKLATNGTPTLSWADTLPTGGNGGAGTESGILQFRDDLGAVANFGSNTVSPLVRYDNFIAIGRPIKLATGCTNPDSVALTKEHLFVVGKNCAESHTWPGGSVDGTVSLSDPSAAQIAVGKTWAAVALTSGSLLQLPLSMDGALSGVSNPVALPTEANNTPLGEAFWDDVLGFTPAHSPDNFAIVDKSRNVYPVVFPTSLGAYPTNAPCWVAKGPGSVWYTGNSPGLAVSIFFSDAKGGVFYKQLSLPGSPTDITVSQDKKWLAVIYTAGGDGYVSVFSIDHYGDLTPVATSNSVGVAGFSGVAFSQ